jgi:ankyrin repeat protein
MPEVSPLLQAVYSNDEEAVSRLLAEGQDLDVSEAAAVGADDRLQQLLAEDAGAPARRSADGFTPLHLASFFGHEQAVRLLLAAGADVAIAADNPSSVLPLHSAVARDNTEIARLLVEAGAEVNVKQQGGWTPLHAAAQNGNSEIVDVLLQHGADPRDPNDEGRTPIDMAAEAGHEEVLDRLRAE